MGAAQLSRSSPAHQEEERGNGPHEQEEGQERLSTTREKEERPYYMIKSGAPCGAGESGEWGSAQQEGSGNG